MVPITLFSLYLYLLGLPLFGAQQEYDAKSWKERSTPYNYDTHYLMSRDMFDQFDWGFYNPKDYTAVVFRHFCKWYTGSYSEVCG